MAVAVGAVRVIVPMVAVGVARLVRSAPLGRHCHGWTAKVPMRPSVGVAVNMAAVAVGQRVIHAPHHARASVLTQRLGSPSADRLCDAGSLASGG